MRVGKFGTQQNRFALLASQYHFVAYFFEHLFSMNKLRLILFFLFILPGYVIAQETAEDLYNKAIEYKKDNKCSQSLVLLEKAVKLKADFGEAWFESGWCNNELGFYRVAIEQLQKASLLLKNNFKISYELGHAYFYLDSVTASLKNFRESIRLKADYSLSYVGLGDLYREKLNNTNEALGFYLKAYAIDSSHKKTNYWIGWCYNDLEKYSKAIPYLEKVIAGDPVNTLSIIELAFSQYSLAKYDEALITLEKVLSLQPKPALALYYAGLCNIKKGKKTDAVNMYNDLVILNSEYALELFAEIKKMK